MKLYFKQICLLIFFPLLISSCLEKEMEENLIISEDYIDGVFFVEHLDQGVQIKIETNKPAKFFPNSERQTFDIEESGFAELSLPQGVYWIDCSFEESPSFIETIPILIMKNKAHAIRTVGSLINMKQDHQGFALVLRHVDARIGEDKVDSPIPEWWKSCDPEVARQLNENGRRNGKKIGDAIKKLQIPIGTAISSEFCRAVQTIEAMELDLEIETDSRLNHENANPNDPMFEDVFDIIRENNAAGVQLLVGHYNMLEANPHRNLFRPFNMSDGFLMKANSQKELEFVGSVPLFLWSLFE
ncbi:Fructose-2,6-bisphosphatase [Aquiflexum balticum DSM 16537]|uniref:Fructose-2,6-bisphosphatase n=1 Tax=Aquiflexum balticum DSM 16537 TaxID=758820 RepID=A0A1W2H5R5_9BACT|nr:histidine phosphatase family protein [Aquiflexum balticum]SMD44275.1 Fructose-2,6-bisphosphatase [Aquiflexum balticum DSM 16537]